MPDLTQNDYDTMYAGVAATKKHLTRPVKDVTGFRLDSKLYVVIAYDDEATPRGVQLVHAATVNAGPK